MAGRETLEYITRIRVEEVSKDCLYGGGVGDARHNGGVGNARGGGCTGRG